MDSLDAEFVEELMAYRGAKASREHDQAEADRMKREQDDEERKLRAQLGD